MIFSSNWLPELFSKAFAPIPDIPIWQWAEGGPFKLRKAPEPIYRSNKTPWTRRGQDLLRKPWHDGRRIKRFGARKSSQSGYTEGVILNPIRWTAKYRPRNCIISVNSQKEVGELRERLVPSLEDLGQSLFTDNADDLSKFTLRLRGMNIWFAGSFSPGGFSNKFSPWVFNDEVDLYGEISEEGNTIENFYSRTKAAAEAFQVVISKPALVDGPIDSFFKRGNQEYWEIECPHHGCHERQTLEWERVDFAHCKDLTGAWDPDRLLNETVYRCKKCGQAIQHTHKEYMNSRGLWVPTAKGDPEIVTQQMSDLYSMDDNTTFGHLAKEFIHATTSGDRTLIQAFRQQRLGLPWEEKIQKIESPDVFKLRAPYRRGHIPHDNCRLLLAMDIGSFVNTRWEVYAFNIAGEVWLIDWGIGEAGPRTALSLLAEKRYPGPGGTQPITLAFIDARYRTDEVYETCLVAPSQLFPVMGTKTTTGARSISFHPLPQKAPNFGLITFLDRDAKFDLYIDRIKEMKPPRIYWPEDVDNQVVREHCAERLIHHKRTGQVMWEDDHKRPNHYGDCTKIAITAVDYMLKARRARILADVAGPTPQPVEAGVIAG